MNDVRVTALVIKAINYSENDKLLTLITLERGKILARLRGCKSPKSKLKFAASPLFFGEYQLVLKDDRFTITGCDAKESFHELTDDTIKYYVASVIMEITNRLTEENSDCSDLFIEVIKSLKILSYSNIDPLIILIKGMLNIMKIAGYQLILDKCVICESPDNRYLSFSDGGSVCLSHHKNNNLKVSSELTKFLNIIDKTEISELLTIRGNILLIKESVNTLNMFYTYQTDSVLNSIPQLLMII